ncbi:MAG: hypothetical protein JM57_09105 [Comamonadaceae bacterium BICA1-1]|nr:MAG: hypothetical protein JM57_09105 [Comamonadaceae bacterium BICA1-1]
MAKVNLDALIPREDFEIDDKVSSGLKKHTISAEDIKSDAFFFQTLRKPDFQRETNEWEPERVVELIKSFVSGELIPAVILWRSQGGYLFVIDGSHRLSAIAAWVNNDYGDGPASQAFFEGSLPSEQREVASSTRALVDERIGSYRAHRAALDNKDELSQLIAEQSPKLDKKDELAKRITEQARNLGSLAVQLQWVEGDISKAEGSFFKINQQAAPIDKTELKLLRDRRKPASVAARAIIRSGFGHKYWSKFSKEKQQQIRSTATEVYQALFIPLLINPIKTLDLPIAGKITSAQTLPLVVDMISIVISTDGGKAAFDDDDATGQDTLGVLKRVKDLITTINSNQPGSLGLHPAVYFYSQEGRFKSSSFLGMIKFIGALVKRKKLDDFTRARKRFEAFVLEYDFLAQQINRKHRTADRSYPLIANFYQLALDGILGGLTDAKIVASIKEHQNFDYLVSTRPKVSSLKAGKSFDSDTKSEVFIRSAINSAPKCGICGGFVHANAISIDHKNRRRDGGSAVAANGQLAHPYCNTGYKN